MDIIIEAMKNIQSTVKEISVKMNIENRLVAIEIPTTQDKTSYWLGLNCSLYENEIVRSTVQAITYDLFAIRLRCRMDPKLFLGAFIIITHIETVAPFMQKKIMTLQVELGQIAKLTKTCYLEDQVTEIEEDIGSYIEWHDKHYKYKLLHE